MIVLGAVILLVAVFGDYGACNENRTALGVVSYNEKKNINFPLVTLH